MGVFIAETEIQPRFDDFDVFRHVNNVHQQQYMDLGKSEFFTRRLGRDVFRENVKVVLVSVHNNFLNQILFGDRIVVRTELKAIGHKSITLRQTIVVLMTDGDEKICTQSESVLVAWDNETKQTISVPDAWRELL